jgi:hypothetical protein
MDMKSTSFDASLTLAEAIQRLRLAEDSSGEVTTGMSANAAQAFDMHDAVHILFGCGTSVEGEIAAHVWMKCGTTANIGEMHRAVAQDQHRKALAGIGHATALLTWLRMLPEIVRIVVRARRMKKRIAYDRLSELKQQTIAAIHEEYGIPAQAGTV